MLSKYQGSWVADDKRHQQFYCQHCNKSFSHQSALSRHWLNFHGRDSHPATCDICGVVAKNVRCLKEHLLIKHQTKRLVRHRRHSVRFRCKHCGKEYLERRHFVSHLSSMHPNEDQSVLGSIVCGIEEGTQNLRENFTLVIYVTKKTNLMVHFNNIHGGSSQQVPCHVCLKSYKNQESLRVHLKNCHGVVKSQVTNTTNTDNNV
ncbi:hypothetical protein B566_EDAN018145 [Ephemera danica]|nr:hypothetical protein B566_EDAN018145 [Ephemera danica]